MKPVKISIIIPCLNEAEHIIATLTPLQALRNRGHEIILVDGGSNDDTTSLCSQLVDQLLHTGPGRSLQMNQGARQATGDVLCFLHADTICSNDMDKAISDTLCESKNVWGRFNIRLSSNRWPFRTIEWFINTRSYFTGIATGDQCIFICRNIFQKLSGYADIPLMEDIEISKRLRKISRPVCIKQQKIITSSRRWEENGIINTILLMWSLRLRYFLGSSPSSLVKTYYPHVSKK